MIHFWKKIVFKKKIYKNTCWMHEYVLSQELNPSIELHASSACFYNNKFPPEYFDWQILIFNACLF